MLNIVMLDQRIKESGKKYSHLANMLGISPQYFAKKRKGLTDFTNRETDVLCKELNITKLTDKEAIFFAQLVDKNGNIPKEADHAKKETTPIY